MSACLQADAIRDSLKSLFSEPALPDNPYQFLAAALAAYVDQSPLWSESDVGIISALDNDGGLDVADAASKLCKLAASSCVLGLPHVLRTVNKDGESTCSPFKAAGMHAKAVSDSMLLTCRCPDRARRADQQPAGLCVPQPDTLQRQKGWLHNPAAVKRAGDLLGFQLGGDQQAELEGCATSLHESPRCHPPNLPVMPHS